MMQEEREPIGSNIHEAIRWMRKELEQRQALIEASRLHFLKDFSPLGVDCLACAFTISIAIIGYMLTSGALAFFIAISPLMTTLWLKIFLYEFTANLKARNRLVLFLTDLEELYEVDRNMDVGFELSARGWFPEDIVKAMMKKREKEIRRQAGSGN